jgi:hypothetical protein
MPNDCEQSTGHPPPRRLRGAVLLHAIEGLCPGRARDNPPVFLLEVAAALLTVLTLRDGIIGAGATNLEMLAAVALWGVALLVAFGVAARRRQSR